VAAITVAAGREQLQGTHLVAAGGDGRGVVERRHAHHAEVVHDRQPVGLDGRRDARNHHVGRGELALPVERRRPIVEVHLDPEWIEHAHAGAAQARCLGKPARGVDGQTAAEQGDVH